MTRVWTVVLFSFCCATACAQYPIYPAVPQSATYAPYAMFCQPPMSYSGLPAYGYQAWGFAAVPFGGINLLPPNPPSPYYVTPSGTQYLEQVRRQEKATYNQLKLSQDLQK